MVHFTKKPLQEVKRAPLAAPDTIQPVVVEFSKYRARALSLPFLYGLIGALFSILVTSLFAVFILGEQINHLWREAMHAVPPIQIASAPPQKSIDAPEAAFPAAELGPEISPLPSKALILGRDFQKTRTATKLPLVPMLEKLPVGAQPKHGQIQSGYVEIVDAPALSKTGNLLQKANEAADQGDMRKAAKLYEQALILSPKDDEIRQNCVALLLELARFSDESGDVKDAVGQYQKALRLWNGNAQTKAAIQARLSFLQSR